MAQVSIGDLTGSAPIDLSDNSLAGQSQLTALSTPSEVMAALPKPVNDPKFKEAHFSAVFEKASIPFKSNTVDVKASVNILIADASVPKHRGGFSAGNSASIGSGGKHES
jgi:hypothetical protein